MLKLYYDNKEVDFLDWKYPAGEIGVRAPTIKPGTEVIKVACSLQSSDDIMQLMLLTNAIKQQQDDDNLVFKVLEIGYMAYGRQDRVATPGDPIATDVMGELVGSLGFNLIKVHDVHSTATFKALDKHSSRVLDCKPNERVGPLIVETFNKNYAGAMYDDFIQVIPDAGAAYKYDLDCYLLEHASPLYTRESFRKLYMEKVRDPVTGRLSRFAVKNFNDVFVPVIPKFVIIDDICDGGGTFIGIADLLKKLYPTCHLYLFVTHGIFSMGTRQLTSVFDGIYTTNSYHMDRVGLVDGIHYAKLI